MSISQNITPGGSPEDLLTADTHGLLIPLGNADLPLTVHRFHRLQGEVHNVGEPGGQLWGCQIWVRELTSATSVEARINFYRKKQGRMFGELTVGGVTYQSMTFLGFRFERSYQEGVTAKFILQGWLMWKDTGPSEGT